jgi:hypothetical protein
MNMRHVSCALLCLVLTACSSVPYTQRLADRQADYAATADDPVASFRYTTDLYSWEAVSDTQVAVYTRPLEAYLLDLGTKCPDILSNYDIALTSSFGKVTPRFDKVLTGAHHIPCVIQQIRPVDVQKLRELRELREKRKAKG